MSIKNMKEDNQLLDDEDIYEDDYEDNEIDEYDQDDLEDDDYYEEDIQETSDYEDEEDDYGDEYEDYKPRKKKKKRRRKKIKGLKFSFGLIMIFIILGISALLSLTIIFLAKEYMGIDKPTTTYIIEIPEGSTIDEVTDILYDNNIIKVKELFKLMVTLKKADDKIVSGEHEISPSMDYGDMISELETNLEETKEIVTVTLPEGVNVYDAASILEEQGVCDARSFVYYFNGGFNLDDYTFSSYLPTESTLKFIKLEGYLFPDTYEFYKNEDAEIVCRKIFDNFEKKITTEYYSRMQQINMTLDEVITLASIVQREAGNVEDMKMISSVFHNRLDNPDTFPMLQSDPTRVYAEEVIHVKSDIVNTNMEDAYNTYKSAGLPPGAICNPGIEAIEAVLYPADTEYYYFCANVETKETYYAKTLEEHNANLELAGIELED